ncbi:ABC transporter substrate-binding protein [Halomonas cupida]|uniref:ABC transporter substrate-binding protein n=1 Tax=Halomonas cupida TaxID=44933 RepID=A0A1M7GMY6_9GAMM|nr:TRAP transporter substrate-binding protein [Halomonas cupida]GEN23863.1 ABC transporter substrate-binding protein [Halomonas cupida]SHM17488.1 tripartite ATP-independent transporter solute receptor, DctP family [Halomonas cupida]
MNVFRTLPATVLALGLALASADALAAITARIATSLPDSHPQTLGARKFAELLTEQSNGEIEVQVFGNGVLGNDVNLASMLQAGTLEFNVPSTATLASLNPDFSVISLPFQFDNATQVDAVLDGLAGRTLLDSLADKGIVGLDYWDNGFRHITNSRHPVETADDIDGLKIRTMQNELYIDMFNGLGANAIPMPVNELFTALETRTVDGQENPFTVIDSKRFYEVQRYLSQTGHAYDAQVLIASKRFIDSLSEEQQQLVRDVSREAALYQRQVSRELNDTLLARLQDQMSINEVPLEERQLMRERLMPVIEEHRAEISEATLSAFDAALAESR